MNVSNILPVLNQMICKFLQVYFYFVLTNQNAENTLQSLQCRVFVSAQFTVQLCISETKLWFLFASEAEALPQCENVSLTAVRETHFITEQKVSAAAQ